jgi:DUF3102 family protein
VTSIIETGQILIKAKAALPHGDFGKMLREELPFSRYTAHRLMAIARNPALVAHAQHLPPSWMTLSYLARLPEGEVEKKIANGEIHPGMQRRHAAKMLQPVRELAREPAPIAARKPLTIEETAVELEPDPPPEPNPERDLAELIRQLHEGDIVSWLNDLPKAQRIEFIQYMIGALDVSTELNQATITEYRAQLKAATRREAELEAAIAEKDARIADLERHLKSAHRSLGHDRHHTGRLN